MKLKRRAKRQEAFSMASMTDIIFLLLIFFMVTSTLVVPNALNVLLPQSNKQTKVKTPTRITIDKDLNYFISTETAEMKAVDFQGLSTYLEESAANSSDFFVALYADASIPYGELVKVMNLSVEYGFKMVLATRPLD